MNNSNLTKYTGRTQVIQKCKSRDTRGAIIVTNPDDKSCQRKEGWDCERPLSLSLSLSLCVCIYSTKFASTA